MLLRALTPRVGRSESRRKDCYRPQALPAVEPRLTELRPLRKHASGLLSLREPPRARVIAPQARGPPLEKGAARTKLTSESRFTGKEEDVEVGLTYFGKRFLSTNLNRWVSPDPLTIHGLGADLNVYAYVSGAVLKSVDPLGLNDKAVDPKTQKEADEVAVRFKARQDAFMAEQARLQGQQQMEGGTKESAKFATDTARIALEKTAKGRGKAVVNTLNPIAKADAIIAAAKDPKAAAVEAVKGFPIVSTVVAVHELSTSLQARDADGVGTSISNGVLAM